MEEKNGWNIYMVTMKNGNIYTGISNNVLKRFDTHCNGKGAKCLRGKGPLKLSWFSKANYSHGEAASLEYTIKKQTKKVKLQIIKLNVLDVKTFLNGKMK
ncbi:242L [Invertebrate iridescent virus Kaz2018]|uniref:Putative GIY-YIG domain-containing protein 242L n=1 Tax=Invertebrate iridescent virus 6 TaxID=176652 RepID=242L_IIV6|nr:242L [Invertebrate iridescent virus 6]Q91FT0.1 RecName: Full=Putative GIY-YIG domain-containing protein 242L [Invertebrate iridescent virus 6]AAK82103.1 242L [Invertebrate iridescent virus 6]QNH08652.1 242L [Invertebrate iridescent virus Kaz2018]